MKKIIILYTEYGSGHISAAKNLKEILIGYDVELINAKKEEKYYITTITEFFYNEIATKLNKYFIFKNMYDIIFKISANAKILYIPFTKNMGKKKISKLDWENIDLIITTFPYEFKRKNIPVINVITDYGFDNIWFSKTDDTYLVSGKKTANGLEKKKVEKKNIHITGIPIKKEFFQTNASKKINKVFFNLGARGQYKYKNLVEAIQTLIDNNIDYLVICGMNKKIYSRLCDKFDEDKIYGFCNDMEKRIKESDLVITKAGGLSLTECIFSETPIIINDTQSFKGQETANKKYVLENKIGLVCSEKNIINNIIELIKEQSRYNSYVDNMKKLKKNNQHNEIIKIVNELI